MSTVDNVTYLDAVRRHNRRHNPNIASDSTMLLRSILGCASESGELASLAMASQSKGAPIDPLSALDELGDVLFNVTRALDALGYTIEQAQQANILKLDSRAEHGKDKHRERLALVQLMAPPKPREVCSGYRIDTREGGPLEDDVHYLYAPEGNLIQQSIYKPGLIRRSYQHKANQA